MLFKANNRENIHAYIDVTDPETTTDPQDQFPAILSCAVNVTSCVFFRVDAVIFSLTHPVPAPGWTTG